MKKIFGIILLSMLLPHISLSQEIRLRSLNEVVFSIYTPWDEKQLNTPIPANLLCEDIDLFVRIIEDIDVDPYLNYSKDAFYQEIESLKQKIDTPLTRREFLQLIVPVTNHLRLSHTKVSPDYWVYQNIYNENGGTYFPVDVKIEHKSIILNKDYSSRNIDKGAEIISINRVRTKDIIDHLLRYSNNSTSHSRLMDIQDNFSFWLWWVYDFADTFSVETTSGVYTIDGLTSAEIDKRKRENTGQEEDNEYRQYEYEQIDQTTGKLTFRDFGIYGTQAIEHYQSFLDSVFFHLRTDSMQNLIIDVRANAGGNDQCSEIVTYLYDKPFTSSSKVLYKKSKTAEDFFRLFLHLEDRDNPDMLKYINESVFGSCVAEHNYGEYYDCGNTIHYPKPDSIRFIGDVYVLSDYQTVSSGVDFVVLIKDYSIGKIIGSETSQSPSNDANGAYFLLPHSNVMAMGATMYAIRPNGDPRTISGVIPDYEVIQSREDKDKGIDTVMDFTMKLIKNKN